MLAAPPATSLTKLRRFNVVSRARYYQAYQGVGFGFDTLPRGTRSGARNWKNWETGNWKTGQPESLSEKRISERRINNLRAETFS
jgi:hypothetical protein